MQASSPLGRPDLNYRSPKRKKRVFTSKGTRPSSVYQSGEFCRGFNELARQSTGSDFVRRRQFESESNFYDNLISKTQKQIANGRGAVVRDDSPMAPSSILNNRASTNADLVVNSKGVKQGEDGQGPEGKEQGENEMKGKKQYKVLAPRPRARLTRFCHSKVDEVSCNSFLSFMKRYDERTAKQIIEEALVPDIADARSQKLHGHRTALKSALKNFTQDDFAYPVLNVPIHRQKRNKDDDLLTQEELLFVKRKQTPATTKASETPTHKAAST